MSYQEVLELIQNNARAIAESRASQEQEFAAEKARREASDARRDKEIAEQRAQREADNARHDKELAEERARRDRQLEEQRAQREADNARRDKELAEERARLDRQLEEQRAQREADNARRDKEIAEQRAQREADNARRDKELAEERARRDQQLEEERAQREADNARRDQAIAATLDRWEKIIAGWDKTITGWNKTMARWDKIIERYGGHMDNEGRKVEDFFLEGLRKKDLVVGTLRFDELLPNIKRERKKVVTIELDALLLNGTMVGILEIKSTLHLNDVVKVRDSLIPRFRKFYSEYQDKDLAVMVAGELINPDAAKLAHELGFIVLSPNNQELKVDDSCYRAA